MIKSNYLDVCVTYMIYLDMNVLLYWKILDIINISEFFRMKKHQKKVSTKCVSIKLNIKSARVIKSHKTLSKDTNE